MLRAKQALNSSITSAAQTARERARMFFAALPRGPINRGSGSDGRMPFLGREEFLETQGDLYLGLLNALHRLEGELERVRGVEEAAPLRKRTADIREQLKFLLEADEGNTVFWLERRGGRGHGSAPVTYLQATPIDVSELLGELLFENFPSIVLTS